MVTWNVLLCCLHLNDLRINIWGSHWLVIKCWQLMSTLSGPSQGFYTQLEFIPKLELISTWEKDDTDIPVDNFRSIRLNKTAVRFSTEYFLCYFLVIFSYLMLNWTSCWKTVQLLLMCDNSMLIECYCNTNQGSGHQPWYHYVSPAPNTWV